MQFNSDDNSLRQTALNQAVLQKEAITPTLLDIIVQYPQLNGARHNHRAFIAALYLLAQFKEKAALHRLHHQLPLIFLQALLLRQRKIPPAAISPTRSQ